MEAVAVARAAAVRPPLGRDEKFFFLTAIVMAAIIVAGFAFQLAAGRSTFAAPPRVHIHAFVFFGWVALYVLQNTLAATGSLALHRRLGWIAAAWVPAMVVAGTYVTVANIQAGRVPPFFQPAYFLLMNPLHILLFAGLVAAAILLRRRTQWHRRLLFSATASLLAPAFGRLLPLPLLIPWAAWAAFLPTLAFPVAGAIRDWRRDGRVHPAWWWGIGAVLGLLIALELLVRSPLGIAIYQAVTGGSPGALPPLGYPPLPGGG